MTRGGGGRLLMSWLQVYDELPFMNKECSSFVYPLLHAFLFVRLKAR
jgi:lipopolysaccharide biosynthesis protein